MGKRMLSILLAVTMLFTMEGTGVYATGVQAEPQQYEQSIQQSGQEMQQSEQEMQQSGQEMQQSEQEMQQSEQEMQQEETEMTETKEGTQQGASKQCVTVSFNLAGGTTAGGESSVSMQVVQGEILDAASVVAPEKKGYLFQGWMDETGAYYMFDKPVTEDFALLASWTPITYRVQFDPNCGIGEEIPEQICTYDEPVILPMNPLQRTGYVFCGWKQKGVGTYQEGSSVKNLTDQEDAVVVLLASWKKGHYTVRFEANGGEGNMSDQAFSYGTSKTLYRNRYVKEGYTFVGWNTRKDGKGKTYTEKQEVKSLCSQDGGMVVLFAMWKGNSYKVKYNGNGAGSGTVAASRHVYGQAGKLSVNRFKRKGYTFVGWNTKKDGTGKTYASGAQVKKLTAEQNGTVTLYAKWKPVKYTITYNTKGGKLAKSAKSTYTIATKTFTLPCPTRKGYDFDGWYRDKKLTKRVGEIKKGSTGNRKLYAKWVKCTRKAKKNSARITTCKATATGTVRVRATIKNRVVSDDDCYYLVYVNPVSGQPYRMAAKKYKKKKIGFTLKTSENQGYVSALFGIAVKKKGKYQLISSTSYVKTPEKAAKNKSSYKLGKTKKGIQFTDSMEEITACGAKNNFLNLTVSMVCNNGTVPYQYNGKTYYFNQMVSYQQIVSQCNKKGINVTMQILLDWTEGQTDLIASRARVGGAAPFYTWNIYSNGAREKMEAIFSYLGSVFGRKNCYVSNWILGNEVNNPGGWNYRGTMSEYAYFKTYAYTFRALYYAIRSQYSNARIFICTDNLWNTAVPGGYSAKHVITSFVSHLNKIQKGLKWNLAYHAYSFPLTYTNFWEGYGITNDVDTPYITMKNLQVLTNYIRKKYGSSVRIILSEQGYTSTWGEANQAAALAYSYYIAACNPMIDAFIIRSYRDNPTEASQGLCMGIEGKEAFRVFKYMDTSKTLRYTNRYLKLIGDSSWKKLVPGYKKSRLNKMYRKG